jgi:DNA-binding MarR family transcriptional regulator
VTSNTRDTRWLTDEEQAAWRGLLRMYAQITTELNRQLIQSDLSLQDYGVLVHLSEAPDGQRRPFELGEALGIEKTRLSHHLTRLQRRGLVVRRPCPTDRRGWLVRITTAGRRLLTEAAPGHVAAVREGFIDRLTPRQLQSILEVSEAVSSPGR